MRAPKPSVLHRSALCAAAVAAILGLTSAHADPLAIGVVEQVDARTSSVVVLGQRYQVTTSTLVSSEASNQSHLALSALAHNSVVWVDGKLQSNGTSRVDSITVLTEQNVPGATQLLLSGVVTGVRSDGHIRIGQLNVDVTPTFASGNTEFSLGDTVQLFGTQPLPQGVFLAGSARRSPVTVPTGVGGTGKIEGVGGTGKVEGVGGTGKVQGVGGTGKIQGVGGTGKVNTQGVGGTGII